MILDPDGMSPLDRYRFLVSAIVPRPIAWVSTVSAEGAVNAAPFSFFTGISSSPPLLGVCVGNRRDGSPKDTLRNAAETGEMVVNVVPWELREEMVACAKDLPHGESELEPLGLGTAPSVVVAPPRIAASPVNLECRVERIVPFPNISMIVGEVVRIHARDDLVENGEILFARLRPLGRLGRQEYLDPEEGVVEIPR